MNVSSTEQDFVQKWMILVISLWMFLVWNKVHPIMDDSYQLMDDSYAR